MPHAGMTPGQLWAIGADTPERIAHAEEQEAAESGENTAEELAALIVACSRDPEGPGCQELIDNLPGDPDGGPSALEDTQTTTITDRNVEVDSTTTRIIDSLTKTTQQVFFTVPTAEQFLNDFETSFSAFGQNAVAAGLGDADFEQMMNPQTGFMQQMFQEFIGDIAQRALEGEDPFQLQGQDGQEPIAIGDRPGETTTTETEQTTRGTEESATRVDENQDSTTTAGDESQDRDSSSSLTEDSSKTSDDTLTANDETQTTEELFQRDSIQPIFKTTPTAFLLRLFGEDLGGESDTPIEERFIGALSTQIRAAAPRRRPGAGNVNIGGSVSARRV